MPFAAAPYATIALAGALRLDQERQQVAFGRPGLLVEPEVRAQLVEAGLALRRFEFCDGRSGQVRPVLVARVDAQRATMAR